MGTKTINAKNSHKEFSLSKYVSHKYLIDFCYIIKYKTFVILFTTITKGRVIVTVVNNRILF
jgi:hypothetical protein